MASEQALTPLQAMSGSELADALFFTARAVGAYQQLVRSGASEFEVRRTRGADRAGLAGARCPPSWARPDRIHPDAWLVLGKVCLPVVKTDG